MNREIKFRSWDADGKIMHPGFTINEICRIRMGDGVGINGLNMIYDFDNLMWLQYTGLLDKNGKEIYEGDVVEQRKKIDGNFISTIIERYKIVYENTSFIFSPIPKNFYTVMSFTSDELSIIGNIYEHPNLLSK